jgi:chromosome partitioning protein
MAKIIGLYNLEKSTAKTISTAYLAEGFSKLNFSVLAVDLCPNLGLTKYIKNDKNNLTTQYTAAIEPSELKSKIVKTGLQWDLLSVSLYANLNELLNASNNNLLLEIFNNYDFVIVDFPSFDASFSDNMLSIINSVIVPIQCEFYSLDELENTLLKIMSNKEVIIEGILLTNHDSNNVLMPKFIENIQANFDGLVFDTIISRSYYLGLPQFNLENYTQTTNHFGFADYLKLANEIIEEKA